MAEPLRCYTTVEFDCSYLPGRRARNLVLDPERQLNSNLAGHLLDLGFRRSGKMLYRPHCDQCQACLALRLPVAQFKPNRSQRRNWRNNAAISHSSHAALFNAEHFDLYRRYLQARHSDSSMSNPCEEEYLDFLTCDGVDTRFHEFRLDGKVIAVAVTDHLPQGLSAVYTFFEPTLAKRGLGTYAILWQIHHAQQQQLPWLYLGYWIEACRAMRYKAEFKPVDCFQKNSWRPLSR